MKPMKNTGIAMLPFDASSFPIDRNHIARCIVGKRGHKVCFVSPNNRGSDAGTRKRYPRRPIDIPRPCDWTGADNAASFRASKSRPGLRVVF